MMPITLKKQFGRINTMAVHNLKTMMQRLAIGTMEGAIKDYQDKELRDRVVRWIEDKSREPFGFYWCLEYGKMNPNMVRKHFSKLDEDLLLKQVV